MALGISTSGGSSDRTPIMKYNAKAGRLFRVDRTNDGSGWSSDEVDITTDGRFVIDLDNIETGWMHFAPGGAPDIRTAPLGQDYGPRPTDKHKMGFKVLCKLAANCGGDVREFTSSAGSVINAVSALHDTFLATREGDKLPVVKVAKVVAEKSEHGTNYAPVFEIVSWVARPAGLGAQASSMTSPAPAAPAAPATGSRQVEPPKAKAAEPEMADDFG